MTVKQLKEFINQIPSKFDDSDIFYVDFKGYHCLNLIVCEDGQIIIIGDNQDKYDIVDCGVK